MSKKTSLLNKLFFRKDRSSLHRKNSGRRISHIEQLENRIAFAVDVVFGAEANFDEGSFEGKEQWMTILLDEGSDAYLKMDATPTNDLMIADNSSFFGESLATIQNVDTRINSIHVYNGSLVDRQVRFPSEEGYSPDFGLLPTSYPTSGESLAFAINSREIDLNSPVSGTIYLRDESQTVVEFSNTDINGDVRPEGGDEPVWQITNSPISIAPAIEVSVARDYRLPVVNVASTGISDSGTHGIPYLELDFDASENNSFTSEGSARSGVVPPTPVSTFKLFNEEAHNFIPGALQGEIAVMFDDFSSSGTEFGRPISFQVETTARGIVPISFGSASNEFWSTGPRADYAEWVTDLFGTVGGNNNESGDVDPETIRISGDFNTETGELSLRTEINNTNRTGVNTGSRPNGFIPFPIHLASVQVGLQDLTRTDDASNDGIDTVRSTAANNFTMFPGADFTRSLNIELSNPGSKISIESPIIVAGNPNNTNSGIVSLSAGQIQIDSGVSAASRFVIPNSANAAFETVTEVVEVNAPVSSPFFDV